MLDLWPDDIGQSTATATPLLLLKEQAAALGRKTNNVVVGDVTQREGDFSVPPGWFKYDFDIVAPVLGNYRYALFSIAHPVDLYPVQVFAGQDLLNGVPKQERPKLQMGPDARTPHIVADSQQSLEEILRLLFSSSKTKRVIQAIIAQSVSVRT